MDKFISAEHVKKGLEELGRSPWANATELCPRRIAIKEALGTVKDLCIEGEPAADVAPVKHGEWLDFYGDGTNAECSLCGNQYEVIWEDSPDIGAAMRKSLFREFQKSYRHCPNCGARMDGGKNNA